MANEVEISVKIDVEKTKKEMEDLRERIRQLNEAEGDNEQLTKELEKEYDKLSENLQKASGSSKGIVDNMAAMPGPVGSAAKGFKGLTAAAKAFILNPIGAVITAIVGALMLMKNALSSTEEGQMKLAKMTGYLTGILTTLKNVLVESGELLAALFSGDWKGVAKNAKEIKDAWAGIGKNMEESVKIAEARLKFKRATAEWSLEESKLRGEMEKQKAIFSDTTKSVEERAAANDAAYEAENKIIAGQIALKEKEIDLLKQEQALSGNTLEDNIELINLEKDLQNLQNQKDSALRTYTMTKNRIAKGEIKDEKEAEKEAQEAYNKEVQRQTNLINLQKLKVDEYKQGTKEWADAQDELIKMQYELATFQAQGDETLLAIAEGQKKAAEKAAEETVDAYNKAVGDRLKSLREMVAGDKGLNEWDLRRDQLAKELKAISDEINKAYEDQEISKETHDQLMTALDKKGAEERKKIAKDEADAKREMNLEVTDDIIDSLIKLTDVNAEKSKEMFAVNKALQIAQATIEGLRAGIKIWADETAPTAVKAAETAALAATTAATIAKIKSTQFGGSGSASASTVTQSVTARSLSGETSRVSDTFVARGISERITEPRTQTVLVLDDVEYKQKQRENIKKVSMI